MIILQALLVYAKDLYDISLLSNSCWSCLINVDFPVPALPSIFIEILLIICSTNGWKLLFVSIAFMSNHQTFCSLFKIRRHIIGCIKNDIVVVGLCSELVVRLSYYMYLVYGRKFSPSQGDRTAVLLIVSRLLYPSTRAVTLKYTTKQKCSN